MARMSAQERLAKVRRERDQLDELERQLEAEARDQFTKLIGRIACRMDLHELGLTDDELEEGLRDLAGRFRAARAADKTPPGKVANSEAKPKRSAAASGDASAGNPT